MTNLSSFVPRPYDMEYWTRSFITGAYTKLSVMRISLYRCAREIIILSSSGTGTVLILEGTL